MRSYPEMNEVIDKGFVWDPRPVARFRWKQCDLIGSRGCIVWYARFPSDAYSVCFGLCVIVFLLLLGGIAAIDPSFADSMVLYAMISFIFTCAVYAALLWLCSHIAQAKFSMIHWSPSGDFNSGSGNWKISKFCSRSLLSRILSGKAAIGDVLQDALMSQDIGRVSISAWISVRAISVRPADSSTVRQGQKIRASSPIQSCIWVAPLKGATPVDQLANLSSGVVIYGEKSESKDCPSTDMGKDLVDLLRRSGILVNRDNTSVIYSNLYTVTKSWWRG